MFRIKIQKLDRRYDGFGMFSHRAHFVSLSRGGSDRKQDLLRYVECRNQLWDRWGPGIENSMFWLYRDSDFGTVDPNRPRWAWSDKDLVIYLRDEALTEFMLSYERWQGPAAIV
jgi:hypothetical protein